MPSNSQSEVQNYEVKRRSLSCSSMCGTPKLRTMWLTNKCTTANLESSPSPTTMGISLTHLVSSSTTVNTPLNDPLSGRFVMKSMNQTKKCSAGVLIGYNKPAGAEVKSLCRWQTWQPRTNANTSCNKPGQQTRQSREDKVLQIPKCLPSAQCISCNKS